MSLAKKGNEILSAKLVAVQSGAQAGSGGTAREGADPLRGDVLVVLAQLFAATQFIGELARHPGVTFANTHVSPSEVSAGNTALQGGSIHHFVGAGVRQLL